MSVQRLLVLALLPLLLTGCIKYRQEPLKGMDLWNRDRTLPQEFWEKRNPDEEATASWFALPFPFQLDHRVITSSRDGETVAVKAAWNDVGIPLLLMLPLHAGYAVAVYDDGATQPKSVDRLSANPFWASSSHKGEDQGWKTSASGVPLLFTRMGLRQTREEEPSRFRTFNALWTLGPMYFGFDGRLESGEELRLKKSVDGYFFTPLLAGGILGPLVWTDAELAATDNKDSAHSEAAMGLHGPLMGWMGYVHYRTKPVGSSGWVNLESEEQEVDADKGLWENGHRVLLGGLLWQDRTQRDEANKAVNSGNGPIWGMFGAGKKDGRRTISVFWIPIKI